MTEELCIHEMMPAYCTFCNGKERTHSAAEADPEPDRTEVPFQRCERCEVPLDVDYKTWKLVAYSSDKDWDFVAPGEHRDYIYCLPCSKDLRCITIFESEEDAVTALERKKKLNRLKFKPYIANRPHPSAQTLEKRDKELGEQYGTDMFGPLDGDPVVNANRKSYEDALALIVAMDLKAARRQRWHRYFWTKSPPPLPKEPEKPKWSGTVMEEEPYVDLGDFENWSGQPF